MKYDMKINVANVIDQNDGLTVVNDKQLTRRGEKYV